MAEMGAKSTSCSSCTIFCVAKSDCLSKKRRHAAYDIRRKKSTHPPDEHVTYRVGPCDHFFIIAIFFCGERNCNKLLKLWLGHEPPHAPRAVVRHFMWPELIAYLKKTEQLVCFYIEWVGAGDTVIPWWVRPSIRQWRVSDGNILGKLFSHRVSHCILLRS